MESEVFFKSGGLRCAADLYLPDDVRTGAKRPGLVIGHGFSVVKEALVDHGRAFASAGFVTLAIDYRTFGRSEGEPRASLFPMNEAEDYRNGISYLESRPEVDGDRIGIWGTSFSGGLVMFVGAMDRRVKAVVSQVPAACLRRTAKTSSTSCWSQPSASDGPEQLLAFPAARVVRLAPLSRAVRGVRLSRHAPLFRRARPSRLCLPSRPFPRPWSPLSLRTS